MSTVYKLTFTSEDGTPPSPDELAESLARHFDCAPTLVEDISPRVVLGEPFIAHAHIIADDALYAACPMTASNLPLLLDWMANNHAELVKASE